MNKTQKISVLVIAVVAAVMFVGPFALSSPSHQAFAGGWGGWGWHHHWWHHHWGWGWHHGWHGGWGHWR